MLYALDGIIFEVAPLNVEGFERATGSELVEKAVLGAQPPLESVGPTGEDLSFRGRLYAALMPTGVAALEVLRAASQDGKPRHLQRGDGTNFGWWRIAQLRESGSFLESQGVARLSVFDLSLRRSQAPAGAEYRGAQ
jgi:phage protein U